MLLLNSKTAFDSMKFLLGSTTLQYSITICYNNLMNNKIYSISEIKETLNQHKKFFEEKTGKEIKYDGTFDMSEIIEYYEQHHHFDIYPDELTDEQKRFVYAEEADVLNVALFGMTAKEWKENNPNLKGNIRDYTDLKHLLILCNLENTNAELINDNIPQKERLIKLNNSAIRQMKVLENDKTIKELETLNQNLIDIK